MNPPQLPEDEWQEETEQQEGDCPTQRDVVRYWQMKDRLVLKLPWYTAPVDAEISYVHPNKNLVQIKMFTMGLQWAERRQLKVLGILPPVPDPTEEPKAECPEISRLV